MDPHERLRGLLRGTGCPVCGGTLDEGRIRVLAERDDLAFVELPCRSCGAATLGMLALSPGGRPRLDRTPVGELTAADEARLADQPPIDGDDVLSMHRFLERYRGDLRSLLDGRRPGNGPTGPTVQG